MQMATVKPHSQKAADCTDMFGKRPNRTGIPAQMKCVFEQKSGLCFDDVRVHYNSDAPEAIQALAFTYGDQVFLGKGQEKLLPHELGHVVQQKSGQVQPTHRLPGGIPVNLDSSLEHQADDYLNRPEICARRMPQRQATPPAVVQGYLRAGHSKWIQSAAFPNQNRQIMIREGEAASVYLRNGIIIPQLTRLGIEPDGPNIQDPMGHLPAFRKHVQKRIPGVHKRKILFWWFNKNSRSAADRAEADRRLTLQHNALITMIRLVRQIRRGITNIGIARNLAQARVAFNALRTEVDRNILELYGENGGVERLAFPNVAQNVQNAQNDHTKRISTGALGGDIAEAVLALFKVTEPPARRAHNIDWRFVDQRILLNLAESEFKFRLSQVEAERQTIRWKPMASTACDGSAIFRGGQLGDASNKEKADFDRPVPFNSEVAWNYHYATNIPVPGLTNDKLFLEDAVGKSSSSNELANAHWFARLYGTKENQPVRPRNRQYPIVSNSRFNHMSRRWRQAFFDRRRIQRGHSWKLIYSYQNTLHTNWIEVRVNNNLQIEYNERALVHAVPADPQNVSKIDFLLRTADEVLDGWVLEEYAVRAARKKYNRQHIVDQQNGAAIRTSALARVAIKHDFIPSPPNRGWENGGYRIERIQ